MATLFNKFKGYVRANLANEEISISLNIFRKASDQREVAKAKRKRWDCAYCGLPGLALTEREIRALVGSWRELMVDGRQSNRMNLLLHGVFSQLYERNRRVGDFFCLLAYLSTSQKKAHDESQLSMSMYSHAIVVVNVIDSIIRCLEDRRKRQPITPVNVREIGRFHANIRKKFVESYFDEIGELLAEQIHVKECVTSYADGPRAWTLFIVSLIDELKFGFKVETSRRRRSLAQYSCDNLSSTTKDTCGWSYFASRHDEDDDVSLKKTDALSTKSQSWYALLPPTYGECSHPTPSDSCHLQANVIEQRLVVKANDDVTQPQNDFQQCQKSPLRYHIDVGESPSLTRRHPTGATKKLAEAHPNKKNTRFQISQSRSCYDNLHSNGMEELGDFPNSLSKVMESEEEKEPASSGSKMQKATGKYTKR